MNDKEKKSKKALEEPSRWESQKYWLTNKWNSFWNKDISLYCFLLWFLLADGKRAEKQKFENKHPVFVNILRFSVILLILPWAIGQNIDILSYINAIGVSFTIFLIYFALRLYATWLYKIWEFLKNGRVLAFVVVGLIVVLLFMGLKFYPNYTPKQTTSPSKAAQSSKTTVSSTTPSEAQNRDADQFIDRLTSFYSTLFAIVGLVVAFAGLGAWNTVKEVREKLKELKRIQEKVNLLMKKNELAKWVRDEFDKDDERRCLSSIKMEVDDKRKLDDIEDHVLEETTDDSWLKMLYSKLLIEKISGCDTYCDDKVKVKIKQTFERAENILKYLEMRDLFKRDSDIEFLVFHLRGLLNWEYYKYIKNFFRKSNEIENKPIEWEYWWKNNVKVYSQFGHKPKKLLDEGINSYRKSIEILKTRGENSDESKGNLAVVLIERSKFTRRQYGENRPKDDLELALKHLLERSKDYNTYWDHARVIYYQYNLGYKSEKIDKKVKSYIKDAAISITESKDRKFFLRSMRREIKEAIFKQDKLIPFDGFPGDEDIIIDMHNLLDKRGIV